MHHSTGPKTDCRDTNSSPYIPWVTSRALCLSKTPLYKWPYPRQSNTRRYGVSRSADPPSKTGDPVRINGTCYMVLNDYQRFLPDVHGAYPFAAVGAITRVADLRDIRGAICASTGRDKSMDYHIPPFRAYHVRQPMKLESKSVKTATQFGIKDARHAYSYSTNPLSHRRLIDSWGGDVLVWDHTRDHGKRTRESQIPTASTLGAQRGGNHRWCTDISYLLFLLITEWQQLGGSKN